MSATKTVWPLEYPEGDSPHAASDTLEDPAYRAFVKQLQQRGFEITWHCATMAPTRSP